MIVNLNKYKWKLCTNRHPNCDGTDWGWIEGSSPEIFWSDNKPFNRKKAQIVVEAHNKSIQLIWEQYEKPEIEREKRKILSMMI